MLCSLWKNLTTKECVTPCSWKTFLVALRTEWCLCVYKRSKIGTACRAPKKTSSKQPMRSTAVAVWKRWRTNYTELLDSLSMKCGKRLWLTNSSKKLFSLCSEGHSKITCCLKWVYHIIYHKIYPNNQCHVDLSHKKQHNSHSLNKPQW